MRMKYKIIYGAKFWLRMEQMDILMDLGYVPESVNAISADGTVDTIMKFSKISPMDPIIATEVALYPCQFYYGGAGTVLGVKFSRGIDDYWLQVYTYPDNPITRHPRISHLVDVMKRVAHKAMNIRR